MPLLVEAYYKYINTQRDEIRPDVNVEVQQNEPEAVGTEVEEWDGSRQMVMIRHTAKKQLSLQSYFGDKFAFSEKGVLSKIDPKALMGYAIDRVWQDIEHLQQKRHWSVAVLESLHDCLPVTPCFGAPVPIEAYRCFFFTKRCALCPTSRFAGIAHLLMTIHQIGAKLHIPGHKDTKTNFYIAKIICRVHPKRVYPVCAITPGF
jgi:hypothetical protein